MTQYKYYEQIHKITVVSLENNILNSWLTLPVVKTGNLLINRTRVCPKLLYRALALCTLNIVDLETTS